MAMMKRMMLEATKNGVTLAVLVGFGAGIYGARKAMKALDRRLARLG